MPPSRSSDRAHRCARLGAGRLLPARDDRRFRESSHRGRLGSVPAPLTYAASIVIHAPASVVYAAVSDVTRTGEWSPVCQECWWDEGDGPWTGAFFTGRNVTPTRTWTTRCEVIVADVDRAFGWSVSDGNVEWIYTLDVVDGGTELTESWVFTEKGQHHFRERFGDTAPEEIDSRTTAARDGIPVTLAAIKQAIERATA